MQVKLQGAIHKEQGLAQFVITRPSVRARGVVFLGILCGGVPQGSQNPDPISDQKMSFFTPIFRPVLQEIMSSLLRLEHQQKTFS